MAIPDWLHIRTPPGDGKSRKLVVEAEAPDGKRVMFDIEALFTGVAGRLVWTSHVRRVADPGEDLQPWFQLESERFPSESEALSSGLRCVLDEGWLIVALATVER